LGEASLSSGGFVRLAGNNAYDGLPKKSDALCEEEKRAVNRPHTPGKRRCFRQASGTYSGPQPEALTDESGFETVRLKA